MSALIEAEERYRLPPGGLTGEVVRRLTVAARAHARQADDNLANVGMILDAEELIRQLSQSERATAFLGCLSS